MVRPFDKAQDSPQALSKECQPYGEEKSFRINKPGDPSIVMLFQGDATGLIPLLNSQTIQAGLRKIPFVNFPYLLGLRNINFP